METVDDEIRDLALKFIEKAKADGKPFFLWLNPTRMHIVTHLSPKYQAMRNSKNGWSIHEAGMAQLDDDIGLVMKKLKDMGVDDNTIVVFTTDNGTEVFTWPDGGQTPFAQSKGTVMEGGFRAPAMIRWPGKVPAGKVENGIISGLDWFPTLLAAAGNPNIIEELKKGKRLGDRTYKVHLDGYDQTDMITGKGPSNRHEIFYFGESTLGAVRIDDFKYRFIDQPGGWLGAEDPRRRAVPDQPSPRSFRAHGLAREREQDRGAAILRLVQVRILALRVRPAAGGEARHDGRRVPADAERGQLQSRCGESADRGGPEGPRAISATQEGARMVFRGLLALLFSVALATSALAQTDPLPSWNDGAAKKAIVEFVQATTTQGGPKFVPPEARIAVFDQDGTTWVEQPMYTQVMYCLERVPVLVKAKPELKDVEPFKTVLSGNREAMAKLTMPDLEKILAATLTGMTVEQFSAQVKDWLATAKHPRFKRPYTELVYQPMLEVMKLFRANGYKTYFVTGGGQDFVRMYSEQVYGVPPEQVVGSAGATQVRLRQERARPSRPRSRSSC